MYKRHFGIIPNMSKICICILIVISIRIIIVIKCVVSKSIPREIKTEKGQKSKRPNKIKIVKKLVVKILIITI